MKTVYRVLPAPAAPSLSFTASGALAATTYYVRIVYCNSFLQIPGTFGLTTGSTEVSISVPINNVLVVTSPPAPPTGTATGWNVYVSTSAGTERLQNGATPIAIGINWTEPNTGLVVDSLVPTTNTNLQDNTANVLAYLLANRTLYTGLLYSFTPAPARMTLGLPAPLKDVYYFTDLPYPVDPTFVPLPFTALNSAVANIDRNYNTPTRPFRPIRIKRSAFEFDLGLKATSTDFEWDTQDTQITPSAGDKLGRTAISPYVDAYLTNYTTGVYENFKAAFINGQLDNGYVIVWRVFMPTQGDCDTLGVCVVWGGRISTVTVDRGAVRFTATSALELLQRQVPTQLIEPGNRNVQYARAIQVTAPGSGSNVLAGSTTTVIISGGTLQAPGSLAEGFLTYLYGSLSGFTGAQVMRAIQNNANVGGNNVYYLYEPLPIVPRTGPGTDLIHVYLPVTYDNSLSANFSPGFPYVPVPETAI